MKLIDVSISKTCPGDCGCMEIVGPFSSDSMMWTHENVDVVLKSDDWKTAWMRGGVVYEHELDDEDEYTDLSLPCGSLIGYVDVRQLPVRTEPL